MPEFGNPERERERENVLDGLGLHDLNSMLRFLFFNFIL